MQHGFFTQAEVTRAKSARPGKRPATCKSGRKAEDWPPAEVSKIPVGAQEEIEHQRRVVVTVTTLLHCLHAVLERQDDTITSQLPVDQWHTYIDEPTLADAILDRLVHNSHRVTLKGGSMRKHKRATDLNA